MSRRSLTALVVLAVLLATGLWVGLGHRRTAPRRAAIPSSSDTSSPVHDAGLVAPIDELPASKDLRSEVEVSREPETDTHAPPPTDALLEVLVVAREDGQPVPGAEIVAVSADSPGFAYQIVSGHTGGLDEIVCTDDRGQVLFRLPAGTYRIHSWSIGDDDVEQTSIEVPYLVAGCSESIVFPVRTRSDRAVFGSVVDGETKAPIEGASVRVIEWSELPGSLDDRVVAPVTCLTNPTGLFQVEAASWKDTYARIDAPGCTTAIVCLRSLSSSSLEPSLIRLDKEAVLLVTVEERGLRREGTTVRVEGDGNQLLQHCEQSYFFFSSSFTMVRELETGADGSCRFENVPSDVPLKIEILEHGRLVKRMPDDCVLQPGSSTDLNVRLGSGCRIEGLALNQEGEPVPRMHLWLIRADEEKGLLGAPGHLLHSYEKDRVVQSARTDASGRFALEDVVHGHWWLGPQPLEEMLEAKTARPSAPSPMASLVSIEVGQTTKELTLNVYQGLYIRGRVLWPGDSPREGLGQIFCRTDGATFDGYFDRDQGTFVLGPLVPGEYEVTAYSSGFLQSDPVRAQPGEENALLRLKSGGTISGRLLGEPEERLDGWVHLVPRTWQGGSSATSIDPQGTFELRGIAPGTYDLLAETNQGRVGYCRQIEVVEDSECPDLQIEIQSGATLRCRVETDAACILVYQAEAVVGAGYADPSSPFTLRAPSGESVVRFGPLGRAPSEWTDSLRVDLNLGGEQEIVLRMESR